MKNIYTKNRADELAPDFKQIRVRLSYNGKVHWEPGGIFTTTCDIDIRYFPFDEQLCPIQIGAWAYYSARMNLTNATGTIPTHNFRMNGEWQVIGTSVEWLETILPCCPDTRYPYVQFTLYLRRRHAFYIMNIVLPCSLLSVLVMIVFCLPPDAGEKISLGISVLLAFTVFLLMVAENVPRTSLHIPIIVIYLTCTMAFGTVSVCLTVLVLNLHHRDSERKIPKWVRIIVLNYLSKLLCVSARRPKSLADRLHAVDELENKTNVRHGLGQIATDMSLLRPILQEESAMQANQASSTRENGQPGKYSSMRDAIFPVFQKEKKRSENCQEWKELAHVMDRLFFILVFIFMNLSALIIFLVPYYREQLNVPQPVDEERI
ncbi:DgyrCDS2509 [Dimorphilus gyrociliatus]|uniref:DgyrCDS2509 n=1 Tax=Dimorphilus gyrociliatus TaxID=2664684 RepID=A0A7I8VAQ3_9ANNE|nr:DgyrCDS2509 [Dimorphilus gyrociliatus]